MDLVNGMNDSNYFIDSNCLVMNKFKRIGVGSVLSHLIDMPFAGKRHSTNREFADESLKFWSSFL